MKRTRQQPAVRSEAILTAALIVAQRVGYQAVTREGVAKQAGVTDRLVSYYFGTMPALKRAIMREAVKREVLPIIAQGIVNRDRQACKVSDALRTAAMAQA